MKCMLLRLAVVLGLICCGVAAHAASPTTKPWGTGTFGASENSPDTCGVTGNVETLPERCTVLSAEQPGEYGSVVLDSAGGSSATFKGRVAGWGAQYKTGGVFTGGGTGGPGGTTTYWDAWFNDANEARLKLEINGPGAGDDYIGYYAQVESVTVSLVSGNPEMTYNVNVLATPGIGDVQFTNYIVPLTVNRSVRLSIMGIRLGNVTVSASCNGFAPASKTVPVVQIQQVEMKRDVELPTLFATSGCGSVGKGDKYDFRALMATGSPTTGVAWELWDIDGINVIRATGDGTTFSSTLNDDGEFQAIFYVDSKKNRTCDSGEHSASLTFDVKEYVVHPLRVACADKVIAPAISSILQDMENRISIRHNSSDYRAAVKFTLSGSLTSWKLAQAPITVLSDADYSAIVAAVDADVHIVSHAEVVRKGLTVQVDGLTTVGNRSSIVVRSSANGGTWIHEYGHGSGFSYDLDSPGQEDRVMWYMAGGAGNEISDAERNAYEN